MPGKVSEMTAIQVLFKDGEQFTGRVLMGKDAARQAIRLRLLTTLFYNVIYNPIPLDYFVNSRVDQDGTIVGDLYASSIGAYIENQVEQEDFVVTCIAETEWDAEAETVNVTMTVQLVGDDQPLEVIETFGGASS